MRRTLLLLLALLTLALASVACGGTTAEPAPEPVVEEPAATEEMAEEPEATEEMAEEPEATEEMAEEEDDSAMAGGDIVMSFVPSGDTQEIVSSGDEIAAMIADSTGLTIEANVATSYAAVVEAMCAGNAQVGWLNTFSYILANERGCADVSLATVRFGNPFYTGQIIASEESGITSLADVDPATHTVCWVDPLSTSGYIIPRVVMAAAGIDVDALESTISGSHPNVVTAVYNGDCDLGATFVDARSGVEDDFPDVMEKVIVIEESPQIPNDTVAFSSDIDPEARQAIVDALLEIADSEAGATALEQVYEIEGFAEVDDSFYDAFRTQLDAAGVNVEDLAEE